MLRRWDGFGPTTTSRFHEMFTDPFAFSNDRFTSTFRSADASGFLDGVAVFVGSIQQVTINSTAT
jgi:hypothetical protein